MKLIVGLGNPGKEYENTRHNIGFIIIDSYCNGLSFKKDKNYLICNQIINNENVIFIKPLTFMNLSGNAVVEVVNYYKIDPKDILVIHDDLDLPAKTYRIKYNSSSGGHNGIKSIISCLGTNSFGRLKVGIGNNSLIETKDYVLNKLSTEEILDLKSNKYREIIDCFIENGIEKTMNNYNGVK